MTFRSLFLSGSAKNVCVNKLFGGPDLGPLLLRMDKCLSALKKILYALKALHTFLKKNEIKMSSHFGLAHMGSNNINMISSPMINVA